MNLSYRLFTVRGIDIRVHITFIFILLWASYYWSSTVDSTTRGVVFGVLATILLFACVVLHELGHSVQAQAYGIPVRDITLLPIGGVARLEEIPDEPKKEFRIAIAGPAVNVVIAIILSIIAALVIPSVLSSPGSLIDKLDDGTWQALLSYLLFANIWLVLFNLIPAFPMDGGRIFRSLLAMKLPYKNATLIAARVAQFLAFGLTAIGLYTQNFFLIFIALFVWFGAGQENTIAQNKVVLSGIDVDKAMSPVPIVLSPSDSILRAIELTMSNPQKDFPVIDSQGYVVGMLTFDRVLQAIHEQTQADIGTVMKRDFSIARPDDDLTTAQAEMATTNQRVLPVIGATGKLIGILTTADIAEAFRVITANPELLNQAQSNAAARNVV